MIVIDTSVAGKWIFVYEQDSNKAKALLLNHSQGVTTIIVPDLFFFEIANVLATKSKLSLWKITNSISRLYQMNLQIHRTQEKDLKIATRMAKKQGTSVYDMIYAVVAKKHKAQLITSDERFVKATNFPFVKLLHEIL